MLFNIEPLRMWVHKVLPVVYDDSLSYYEVLAKTVRKLNEVIDLTDEQTKFIQEFSDNLTDAINEWEEGLTDEWTNYKNKIDEEWENYKSNTNEDIEIWKHLKEVEIERAVAEGIYAFAEYFEGLKNQAVEAADRAGDEADRAEAAADEAAENAVEAVMPTLEDIFDNRYAFKSAIGSPLVAQTAAEMTDTNKIYVYVGDETGYVSGNWYYYDGTAWVSGGVYNSVAVVTDTTLTQSGVPADAKATGDEITNLKSALTDVAKSFTKMSAYLYKQNVYINTNGEEIPIIGYDTYKIPLNNLDILYLEWTENPCGTISQANIFRIQKTDNTFINLDSLHPTSNDFVANTTSTTYRNTNAIVISKSDYKYFYMTVQNGKEDVIKVSINSPYVNLNTKNVQTAEILSNNYDNFIKTKKVLGTDSKFRVCDDPYSSIWIHVKAGDKFVFSQNPMQIQQVIASLRKEDNTTISIIYSETITIDYDGVLNLMYNTNVNAKVTYYPINSIKINESDVLNLSNSEVVQKKVNIPLSGGTPVYGTSGQVLKTNGDGTTRWDIVSPTDEQVETAVEKYLEEYPPTTVEDNSITYAKLNTNLKNIVNQHFSTEFSVKEFGAVCDASTDDSDAIQLAIDTVPSGSTLLIGNCCLTKSLTINKILKLKGENATHGNYTGGYPATRLFFRAENIIEKYCITATAPIEIENLIINALNLADDSHLLYMNGASVVIRNSILQGYNGLKVSYGYYCKITNSVFYNNGNSINLTNCYNFCCSETAFHAGGTGFELTSGSIVNLVNCSVENYEIGAHVPNASVFNADMCYFEPGASATPKGISVDAGGTAIVTRSHAYMGTGYYIYASGTGCRIVSKYNKIAYNTMAGVYYIDSTGATVYIAGDNWDTSIDSDIYAILNSSTGDIQIKYPIGNSHYIQL